MCAFLLVPFFLQAQNRKSQREKIRIISFWSISVGFESKDKISPYSMESFQILNWSSLSSLKILSRLKSHMAWSFPWVHATFLWCAIKIARKTTFCSLLLNNHLRQNYIFIVFLVLPYGRGNILLIFNFFFRSFLLQCRIYHVSMQLNKPTWLSNIYF